MEQEEREALRSRLLEEWAAVDPEGMLSWLDGRSWISRPALAALGQWQPEMMFRHVVLRGDGQLLSCLCRSNPAAALSLLQAAGVPLNSWQVANIFYAGSDSDPDFAKHLNDVADPGSREVARDALQYNWISEGRLAELGEFWRQNPDYAQRWAGSRVRIILQSGAHNRLHELIPGDPGPTDGAHPLETLAFIKRLQAAYLPGDFAPDWRALVTLEGVAGIDPASLEAVARGDRSTENLEAAAKWWLGHDSFPHLNLAEISDPAFRDLCLKQILTSEPMGYPDESKTRQGYIDLISDEKLKAEMQALAPRDDGH